MVLPPNRKGEMADREVMWIIGNFEGKTSKDNLPSETSRKSTAPHFALLQAEWSVGS